MNMNYESSCEKSEALFNSTRICNLMKNYSLLDAKTERELLCKKNTPEWDQARDTLVLSNLRLIASVARQYDWIDEIEGDLEDLIMHGILGFMKALENFDVETGNKLSTYASYWIHQEIQSGVIYRRGTIRLPAHIRQMGTTIMRAEQKLALNGIAVVTNEMIEDYTGIPIDQIEKVKNAINMSIVSMNAPIGEQGDDEYGDFIQDNSSPVDEMAVHNALCEELTDAMNNYLTPKEKDMVLYRFGFIDGIEHTLQECSQYFDLSKERCRQLQNNGIEKLRQYNNRRKILPKKKPVAE